MIMINIILAKPNEIIYEHKQSTKLNDDQN